MKWFKHDSKAHRDPKIRKLTYKYRAEGYALYWYCIELIAGSLDGSNITFELEEDAELIAMDLGIDTLKVEEIMRYMVDLKLFTLNQSSNRIVCLKLANRLDESASKNPEIRRVVNLAKKIGHIKSTGSGFVYMVQSNDLYKIGMSTNLHKRLADIKTSNPHATISHTIESIDPRLLESILHNKYKHLRADGEWFSLTQDEVSEVCSITDGDNYIQESIGNGSGDIPDKIRKVSDADKIRLDKIRLENNKFESFWEKYPRKDNKKKSKITFLALSKTKQKLAISDCANRYVGVQKQFIPLATTYLNGERWNDDFPVRPEKPKLKEVLI